MIVIISSSLCSKQDISRFTMLRVNNNRDKYLNLLHILISARLLIHFQNLDLCKFNFN